MQESGNESRGIGPNERIEMDESTEKLNLKSLESISVVSSLLGQHFDLEKTVHEFSISEPPDVETLIRILKRSGFKTKLHKYKNKSKAIDKLPLPALIENSEGDFIVLAQKRDDKYLVFDPEKGKPDLVDTDDFTELWTGQTILVADRKLINSKVKFGIKWFIPTIIKFKKSFIEVLIASFTLQILGLCAPLVMQVIIDKVLMHKALSTLNVLMIGLIGIALFEMFLSLAKNYVFTHTTNRIDVVLSSRLFNHLFKLPLSYFESRRVGDTIARVREVENIRRFLTGAPLSSVLDVMFILVYLVVMWIYSPALTKLVIAILPLYVGLSAIASPLFRNRLKEKFTAGAESQSFLVESVSGIQTIKSFALEPLSQKRWEDRVADYSTASFRTAMVGGTAGAVGQFIQRGGDLAILWLGAHMVMTGDITVGQLIAFRMLSGRVSGPILRIVQMWQEFQQTSVSIERLGDIFNAVPEQGTESQRVQLPNIKGNIGFENVTFRYKVDGPEILRDLSVNIKAGTTVGIVGRSGSGKSTLSKLVQRLYTPERGKIMVDGIDVSMVDPSWLRRQIGVVLQENYLFSGTVKENICIHHPSASMEQIVNAAHLAGAHDFILELSDGYDTQVGEKGAALSGGQRQRIAIARALLTNPQILIFDEATSALDYESERTIQENLGRICHGRTVLIIAHRLSTIMGCDGIMVMDKGQIVEMGTHNRLMNKGGLYHYLFSQQQTSKGSTKNENKGGVRLENVTRETTS